MPYRASFNEPIILPDHFPRLQSDWRAVFAGTRKPVFDRSKTGERLNEADLSDDILIGVDGQPERN